LSPVRLLDLRAETKIRRLMAQSLRTSTCESRAAYCCCDVCELRPPSCSCCHGWALLVHSRDLAFQQGSTLASAATACQTRARSSTGERRWLRCSVLFLIAACQLGPARAHERGCNVSCCNMRAAQRKVRRVRRKQRLRRLPRHRQRRRQSRQVQRVRRHRRLRRLRRQV
jgi:hypothetical protein